MINRRLSAAEAADRLGVKPATLYAYVSRGLLTSERGAGGSTFDVHEVGRLARSARRPRGSAPRTRVAERDLSQDPVFVTELTLIEGGRLFYRGQDAVELSRQRSFEEVAGWLWTGDWRQQPEPWSCPARTGQAVRSALAQAGRHLNLMERLALAVMAASLSDDLRHDLNPAGVPVTGRSLLSALLEVLPAQPASGHEDPPDIAGRLWLRLSPMELTPRRRAVLDSALVLVADHELAPSTLAARVAASFRADPYAVVMTGLGPASGGWPSGGTGAPTEVESLLEEAAEAGAEAAVGARLRRNGTVPHGFGMPLYPGGDPRGEELLSRLWELGCPPERMETVATVIEIGRRREFPPPNVDLGLGALSYCTQMMSGAGQAILTLGKVAGWLAHAMEEYRDPTRFRSRADYVGTRPGPSDSETDGSTSE